MVGLPLLDTPQTHEKSRDRIPPGQPIGRRTTRRQTDRHERERNAAGKGVTARGQAGEQQNQQEQEKGEERRWPRLFPRERSPDLADPAGDDRQPIQVTPRSTGGDTIETQSERKSSDCKG